MIRQLLIKDFAVIDELDLEFGSGLNLLTGETGAGKSVIVDALGVALGERADSEAVRSGCDRAIIEAVVDIEKSPESMQALLDAGISPEDGCIVVSREIQKAGKSQCRINGRPATVSLLKEITDRLVDTHGQHEHQLLLRQESHVEVLDAWCGQEVIALRESISRDYSQLRRLKAELQQLRTDERERARTIDLYQFQIQEIADAKLIPAEEAELLADRNRLANAERLHAAVTSAFELIGDRSGEKCALDLLGEGVVNLEGLADIDPSLVPMIESLQAALYQIEDASRELRAYRDAVEFNPERLEAVDGRLDLIRMLKRKYGATIEEVLEYMSDLETRLDALIHSEERTAGLEEEISAVEASLEADASRLSALRQKGGDVFSKAVERELSHLGMPDAVFQVGMSPCELNASGTDRVEFMISANPGEPPRPLARIASGGEMSRIMLAIKSVMAETDSMPALVFDEIDVGVGGRTAEVIGRKLDALAQRSQVLCITHLPQIASLPGRHFSIQKEVLDGRTVVRVRQLSDEERVSEVARMLGGTKPSDTAVIHASEMLTREREP